MTRIPLATDLKTRTLAPDKDARLKNSYIEGKGDPQSQDYQTMVRKRPSATGGFPIGTGTAQGGIGSPTGLTVVNADTLNTTITADAILTSQTNVIAAGSPTITLPISPTLYQSVNICNVGSGTVTVSPTGTTIPAWTCSWFIWSGFSWGISFGPTCTITLPPTHDFGTVQYAGPSETPYSVPPTTITYATIGTTPCGGSLRQIVTKTYSSRSVANQWKAFLSGGTGNAEVRGSDVYGYASSAWAAVNYPPENNLIGYGATSTAARTAARDKLGGVGTYSITIGVDLYESVVSSISDPTATSRTYTGSRYKNGVLISGPGALLYTANGYNSDVQLTLYYLDIHEVWTYDVI